MSNIFSIGDKVTVNQAGLSVVQRMVTTDCTAGKVYTVTNTGTDGTLPYEDEATAFIDDRGDEVTINGGSLTLVE